VAHHRRGEGGVFASGSVPFRFFNSFLSNIINPN